MENVKEAIFGKELVSIDHSRPIKIIKKENTDLLNKLLKIFNKIKK